MLSEPKAPAQTPHAARLRSEGCMAARKRSRDEHIPHEEGGDAVLLAQLLRHRTTSLRGIPPQDPCTAQEPDEL